MLKEKVVFYIGDFRDVLEDCYIDNPMLLHAYFSFKYATTKFPLKKWAKVSILGIMTTVAKDSQTASYNVRIVSGESDEPISGQTID